MFKELPKNIFRFVFLVLLQVLILNNIQLSGYINPYIYILFILLLPFEIPNWALLSLGFILGLSVDMFSNTIGIHASASVFIAFLRPYLLKLISPRDGYEPGTYPTLNCNGFNWFFRYSLFIVIAHHMFYFFVESFTFSDFFQTLWRIILSSIFTMILIILTQFFTYRK